MSISAQSLKYYVITLYVQDVYCYSVCVCVCVCVCVACTMAAVIVNLVSGEGLLP